MNPIGIGKMDVHDDCDAHDDEMQRFSEGCAVLCCGDETGVRWTVSMGSLSGVKRDADANP